MCWESLEDTILYMDRLYFSAGGVILVLATKIIIHVKSFAFRSW